MNSNSTVTPREIGISLHAVDDWTLIGNRSPDNPRIINKLKLLLPIIFPRTMSENPCTEAIVLTTNSGAEVPNATIVKPMTRSDTLYFLAKAEAPLTSQFAPRIKEINPATTNKIGIIIPKNLASNVIES